MPNFALRWTPLALVLISLSACGTANSNPACVCPPIKEYSREFQKKLADEIEDAPAGAVWPLSVQDYTILRGQITVCIKNGAK